MAKKPSAMKRVAKAQPKKNNSYGKAKKVASKLGGASGQAASAIIKRKAALKKALNS